MQRIRPQVGAFNDELTAAGVMVFADGLMPAWGATVFRYTGDEQVDRAAGPYSDSRRQMGGFRIIEAADEAAATAWARTAARACEGVVELCPFQQH